jgi:transcriptional regulator with XRE-family HTH domain
MDPHHPVWSTPELAQARQHGDAGAIVRIVRRAQAMTLAQLGARCGYSASQISRYERGLTALTDITVLHRFATALDISPATFGLATRANDSPDATSTRHRPVGPTVRAGTGREDGDDPVRRRELLTHAAGLAGAAALGLPTQALAATDDRTGIGPASLDEALYPSSPTAQPVPLSTLHTAVARARSCFQAARYDHLHQGLPALITAATATLDHANTHERTQASGLLADTYIVASQFMVKLNDDHLAWATADRAVQAAQTSGDPLLLADARRAVATAMRRTGRTDSAQDLLLATAHQIEPHGDASPEQLSMYGTLLQVAAYTAAVQGNRHNANHLITEAATTAHRLGTNTNHHFTAFGPTNLTLYQISIAQVLGDNGTAIEHAKHLRPADIPTNERRGRYWIDVARAYHQWGKPADCYTALRAAERTAPAEVRYRPPVHRMTQDLLHTTNRNTLPGLRAFAQRVGVPA